MTAFAARPIRPTVLSKTGPDTWVALGGTYSIRRNVREDCGEITYAIETRQFQREGPAAPRGRAFETLAED